MMGYMDAPEAWWRVNGMARNLGVSLPRSVTDGLLKRSELAAYVGRCQNCAHVEDCAVWLAAHPKHEAAPDYCENKANFTELGRAPQGSATQTGTEAAPSIQDGI